MTNYVINTRNQKIAKVIGNEDGKVRIQFVDGLDSKNESVISQGTFKRWYKQIEYKEKTNDYILDGVVESFTIKNGGTIYEMNAKGLKALKVDGHMFGVVRYSKKGLELWLRSEAFPENDFEGLNFKTANHTFDARIKFYDINANNFAIINNLLNKAMLNQLIRKATTKKALREEKKGAA